MSAAKLTSKGQVTIPVDIRKRMQIEVGDQLVFRVGPDGAVSLRVRRPRVGAGRGAIRHEAAVITREAIGEAVAEGVSRRLGRTTRLAVKAGKTRKAPSR